MSLSVWPAFPPSKKPCSSAWSWFAPPGVERLPQELARAGDVRAQHSLTVVPEMQLPPCE